MTNQVTMAELIKHTIAKLFEWSGTKLLDMTQWEQQLTDLVANTEEDTLHSTGFLAGVMRELYDSDTSHEARAVQKLAGALWFAHSKLQESLETKLSNMETVHSELSEMEVDRDRIRGMLEIKLTEISELNAEFITAKKVISGERAEHEKELTAEKSSSGKAALTIATLQTQMAELAEKLTQYALREETWEATENRLRAKIHEITVLKNRHVTKIGELQSELDTVQKDSVIRQTQNAKREELITKLMKFREEHGDCTPGTKSAVRVEELTEAVTRLQRELQENMEHAAREKLALELANKTFSERLAQTRGSHRALEEKLKGALQNREEQEEAYVSAQTELAKARKEATLMVQRIESQTAALADANRQVEEMGFQTVEKPRRRNHKGGKSQVETSGSEKENWAPRTQQVIRYSELPDEMYNYGANGRAQAMPGERLTARDPIPDSARIPRRAVERGPAMVGLKENGILEERRSRRSQTQESGAGSDTEGEDRKSEALQLLKIRRQLSTMKQTGQNSSNGDTEPSWGLLHEMRKSKTKNDSKVSGNRREDRRDEFPKSVKTINQMISKFRKGGTVNILEHIILFERLMRTLGMTTSEELIKYLPWTFEDKLQAFFLEIDNESYPQWCEFRAEVIKNFSTHRNKHEALLHALAMKCQPNQNPREFFHELKKAFAQVYPVVDTESEEFRRTLFHGLPESTKAHMAGSYSDRRPSQWILEQAKSIYDVSRTVEPERSYKKQYQPEKKVSEISAQKEQLPFESGKPNRQGDDKINQQKQDQRYKEAQQSTGGQPKRDPNDLGIGRDLGVDYYVSRNYTGNRPIRDYRYKPRDRGGQSSGEERRQGQQAGERQNQYDQPQGDDRNGGNQRSENMPYPQAQQRPRYQQNQQRQEYENGQRHQRYSERNDERMAKVEQTLDHLAKVLYQNQMAQNAQQRQAAQAEAEQKN